MLERLKQASVDGLVLGVKWAIFVAVLGVALLLIAGDYAVIRGRALNGQVAYEFITKQIEAQKAVPVPTVAPVK